MRISLLRFLRQLDLEVFDFTSPRQWNRPLPSDSSVERHAAAEEQDYPAAREDAHPGLLIGKGRHRRFCLFQQKILWENIFVIFTTISEFTTLQIVSDVIKYNRILVDFAWENPRG